jgi:hypothetical protein
MLQPRRKQGCVTPAPVVYADHSVSLFTNTVRQLRTQARMEAAAHSWLG